MLEPWKIQELNYQMLGLGAPTDRDNVGYNKPDFTRMQTIGRLAVTLDEDECYLVLGTLRHYKNTQLGLYADEIESSFNRYKEILEKKYFDETDMMFALENIRNGGSHPRADFIKEELVLVKHDTEEGAVIVRFTGYVEDTIRPFGRWIKTDDGYAFRVPYANIPAFLDVCKEELGTHGYAPDSALQGIVDNLPQLMAELKIRKAAATEQPVVVSLGKPEKNRYGHYVYNLNRYSREFTSFLWKAKDESECLTYVEPVSSNPPLTAVSVRKDSRDAFISFCKREGYDVTAIMEQMSREDYHAHHWNDSGLTLVDTDSLTLPFNPYPFQVDDAKEIVSRKKALIGHDMGCGKTFIASLVGMSIDTPKLVVCPESLRLNWQRELERFHKDADIRVVYSKDKIPEFGKDWTIMGYKTATKFRNNILAQRIDCVFCDESHAIKAVDNKGEATSDRAKSLIEITKYATYTYLMTGTPIPTRPKDLYNELCILGVWDKEASGAFYKFAMKFCGAEHNGFGWDFNGASNLGELHNLLSTVMTRRLKKDVLPDLTKQRQFIPLAEVSKEYKDIEKRLLEPMDGDTYMGLAMTGRRVLSAVKISPTLDLAETFLNNDEPVVIVTEFNETMDKFLEAYTDKNGVCHASCIRGGMKDEEKQAAIDDFQSGKNKVCVLNTIAGGVGVTLTAAHNMIVCDYDWTPANMTQVEDRICRAGQTECCNIYYMVCENAILDRVFIGMISDKSAIIDEIVDASENTVDLRNAHQNNLSYLDVLKQKLKDEGGKIKKPAAKKKKKTEIDCPGE